MIRSALKRTFKSLVQRVLDGRSVDAHSRPSPTPAWHPPSPMSVEPQQEPTVNESTMEVTAQALQARLAHGGVALLDVRESFELQSGKLAEAQHIPLNSLPARVGELDAERPLVVYCAHGMRSYSATAYLRSQGFKDVQSLTGGIVAWVGQGGEVVRP